MINLALVGCGGMANWHAAQLKAIPDCKVIALVDVCAPNTGTFAEKYFPDARQFESYDAMLDQLVGHGLDAVVLVTPHAQHYPQAKAALQRGMHVLTEKPMVTNLEHALDLARTVKQTGKKLGITFQAPYTAEFMYLARQRDAGELGKVQLISGQISQGWITATAGKWRQDPAISGGGQMYDTGAHLLNGIMWLMNEPVTEVGCFYDKAGTRVDINGVAILKFASGAMASIAIGGNCPSWASDLHIQTDRMLISTAAHGGKLEVQANNKRHYPHVQVSELPAAHSPHANFINALLGKEPLVCPVRYGVLLSSLMDALYESAHTQRIVQVNPLPSDI
jgi:predicted dehydrogenase